MPGPRREQLFGGGIIFGISLDSQNLLPILPVTVFNTQRDRRADGLSVANACEDFGAVFLYLLPPAPAIAQLTAMQIAVDEFDIDWQSCRQARQERQQRLSVRFSRGVEMKHLGSVLNDATLKRKK